MGVGRVWRGAQHGPRFRGCAVRVVQVKERIGEIEVSCRPFRARGKRLSERSGRALPVVGLGEGQPQVELRLGVLRLPRQAGWIGIGGGFEFAALIERFSELSLIIGVAGCDP